MGIISRRFRWLQQLFPPAEARPINPSVVSDDIALTHEVLPGTELLSEIIFNFVNGAAGVLVVNTTVVPEGKFWYVPYAHIEHDDPTFRRGEIDVQKSGVFVSITTILETERIRTNSPYAVLRPFIMPATTSIRGELDGLLGTARLQLVWAYLELDIGAPIPRL